ARSAEPSARRAAGAGGEPAAWRDLERGVVIVAFAARIAFALSQCSGRGRSGGSARSVINLVARKIPHHNASPDRPERGIFAACARVMLASCAFAPLLVGCHNPSKQKPYDGPTDPLVKVVDDINQNNQRIRSLWARGDVKTWIRDEGGIERYFGGEAVLLYL